MATLILKVGGMSCEGCVGSVTRVLQALPGVESVEVSLERGEALVRFDTVQVGKEAMIQAVDEAGYEAS